MSHLLEETNMKNIKKQVREEIKSLIIAKNGREILNADIIPILDRYRPLAGTEIVVFVQGSIAYFSFSPQQEAFRKKYNFAWR